MPEGQTWDAITEPLLVDCAQLTKANSIEGNKKDNVTVIYTPWSNLKKDGSMAVGQVGFRDQKKVGEKFLFIVLLDVQCCAVLRYASLVLERARTLPFDTPSA